MNAKEQMQALIDGKVIMCEGERYKLDDNGDIVQFSEWGGGIWDTVGSDNFIFDEANYVVDETNCVDFAHALGMMAQGKVMRCLWSGGLFRIHDGALQGDADGWATIDRGELLEVEEMESMWMEVEE